MLRDHVSILVHDASRYSHVLGVGAVVKEQVFAKVLVVLPAVEAATAGRRIGGYDALSHSEAGHRTTHRDNVSRQFVTEQSGGTIMRA